MKPISPVQPGQKEIVLAKEQTQYEPLPVVLAHIDGWTSATSRWHLSWKERLKVLITGSVYSQQLTFGEELQPQRLMVEQPFDTDPPLTKFEKFVSMFFERFDIHDQNGDSKVYLRRWFIVKRPDADVSKAHYRLMLHKFLRSDVDPDHHCHPWKFWSLILKGGYTEETHGTVKGLDGSDIVVTFRKWYSPLSFLYRKATHAHRVLIPKGKTCWTLVLTGPKERSWGFHTKNGFCPWKRYVNGDRCGEN